MVTLLSCLAGDRVEDEVAQVRVGLEAAQPVDELVLDRLGLGDLLIAAFAVTAGRTEVAPHGWPRAAGAVHAPLP